MLGSYVEQQQKLLEKCSCLSRDVGSFITPTHISDRQKLNFYPNRIRFESSFWFLHFMLPNLIQVVLHFRCLDFLDNSCLHHKNLLFCFLECLDTFLYMRIPMCRIHVLIIWWIFGHGRFSHDRARLGRNHLPILEAMASTAHSSPPSNFQPQAVTSFGLIVKGKPFGWSFLCLCFARC